MATASRTCPICDIAIVGSGAAGLVTAIFAACPVPTRPGPTAVGEKPPRVLLLDSAKLPGTKILVAGGGRCNVTHDIVTPDDYHGRRPIVRNILAAFTVRQTIDFFASIGVILKREPTGKLFPTTDNAHTVLDALIHRCDQLGVIRLAEHRVTQIRKSGTENRNFLLSHTRGFLTARNLVLATGGRSLPRCGNDGSGYTLAQRLGHTVTDTHQGLVPLLLAPTFFHTRIPGVSHEATVSVFIENKAVERCTGSMLWTHRGISGPVVMDISRTWVIAKDQGQPVTLRVNVLPGKNFSQVEKMLIDLAQTQPRLPLHRLDSARLPQRLIDALLQHLRLPPERPVGQLARDDRRRLAHALVELELPVTGPCGWNDAEVTAGGVPLNEIDWRTMQSRVCEGLYLVGEMLDCDGRIGGFNFQWAWATGYLAGSTWAKNRGRD